MNMLDKEVQVKLRKKKYDFSRAMPYLREWEKLTKQRMESNNIPANERQQPEIKEESDEYVETPLRRNEKKKVLLRSIVSLSAQCSLFVFISDRLEGQALPCSTHNARQSPLSQVFSLAFGSIFSTLCPDSPYACYLLH